MKRASIALALAAGLGAAGPAAAQNTPMKPGEVTEDRITDALAPPAVEAPAAGGLKARGFAPSRKPAGAAAGGSADVLITFVTASAELTAESKTALDVVARAMNGGKLASLSFVVEGHADPRGDAAANMDLSRARAESVVAYLVKEHGIARERLQPVGKGATEPLNKARPEAAENRRVTFVTRTS